MNKLTNMAKRLKLLGIITVLMLSILSVFFRLPAHAAPVGVCDDTKTRVFVSPRFTGRQICSTYYTNMLGMFDFPSSWAWPSSYTAANNAAGFINFVQTELNLCGNPYNPAGCTQLQNYQVVGNAALIEAMLGSNPDTDFSSNPNIGVQAAINDLNSPTSVWKNTVKYYAAQGWIDWSKFMAGDDHSWDNCNLSAANPNYRGRTDTYVVLEKGITDLYSYCNEAAEDPEPPKFPRLDDQFIVFNNPDGTSFRINRRCGNITGSFSPIVGQFTNTPQASVDNLDIVDPTTVDFHSWVDANIIGAPQEDNVQITRHFYYVRSGVTVNVQPTVTDVATIGNGPRQHLREITGVNVSFLKAGDTICAVTTVNPLSGTLDGSGNILIPTGSKTQTDCQTIANKPYLSIYGNDVFAGGGYPDIDPSCKTGPGNITTSLNAAKSAGSGTQLAAFALGNIKGFNTAKLNGLSPSDVLSFANTLSPAGSFDSNNCISNPTYAWTPTGPSPPGGNITSWNPGTSATYYLNAPGTTYSLPASGGGNIVNGTHITLYVNANLAITKDLTFSTNWASIKDIPSVTFIVQGNIYIDQEVTDLDGTYVARPTSPGTNGVINTCTDGPVPYGAGALVSGTLNDNCTEQLIVNGTFVAQTINWLRVYGSTGSAVPGENPYSGPFPDSAELIINGPETYMTHVSPRFGSGFDYFTSLPPLL